MKVNKIQLYSVPLTISLHHVKGIDTQTSTSMSFGQFSEILPGTLLPPTQTNRVKELRVQDPYINSLKI